MTDQKNIIECAAILARVACDYDEDTRGNRMRALAARARAEHDKLRDQLERAIEVVPFGVCPPDDTILECDKVYETCTECKIKYIKDGE
jgi:hypothetical protein